jgi:hypothetical protein
VWLGTARNPRRLSTLCSPKGRILHGSHATRPAAAAASRPISVTELTNLDEIKGLIARGLQLGALTYGELTVATAQLGLDDSDVEQLHSLFERSEIERRRDQPRPLRTAQLSDARPNHRCATEPRPIWSQR